MAACVQLAVYGVVLDFVVYRQTVVNTTQIALLWVSSDRLVEDMADKLFVMFGVLLLNERDLSRFPVKQNPYTWKAEMSIQKNHATIIFIVFTPRLFLIMSFLSRLPI